MIACYAIYLSLILKTHFDIFVHKSRMIACYASMLGADILEAVDGRAFSARPI
jgi:hypothetical protein